LFTPTMVTGFARSAAFCWALAALSAGCGGESSRDGGQPAEAEVAGPPFDELFAVQVVDCWETVDRAGLPMRCPRFFFNVDVLDGWCVVPDADSFDDYIVYRVNPDGTLVIDPGTGLPSEVAPRGKTPVPGSEECAADGVMTGPANADGEYYPSKFCRVSDCKPTNP
jgi:hypothetical protein